MNGPVEDSSVPWWSVDWWLVASGDGLTRQCGIKGFYLKKSWYNVILNNIGIHIISTYLLVSKHQTISNLMHFHRKIVSAHSNEMYCNTNLKTIRSKIPHTVNILKIY